MTSNSPANSEDHQPVGLERFLAKPARWVRSLPEEWVESCFWLLALIGLIPALRADLLFPHDWIENANANFSVSSIDNPFGLLSLLPALVVAIIAAAKRRPIRWLPVLPFLAVLLANTGIESYLEGLSSAYAVAAFVVFLYFVSAARVRSFYFGAFLAILLIVRSTDELLGWHQVVEFVLVSAVASLTIEAFRQNWPLIKELGRANAAAMFGRALKLWSPTLILIATGWWITDRLTAGTEEGLYESGAVERFCHFVSLGDDAFIDCLPDNIMEVPTDWVREYTPEVGGPNCSIDYIEAPGQPFFRSIRLPECPLRDEGIEAWQLAPAPFFISLDMTVAKRFAAFADDRRRKTEQLVNAVNTGSASAGDSAADLFEIVPGSTGLQQRTCGFGDIKCAAGNLVKSELEDSYQAGRARAKERFVLEMEERANAVADGVEGAADGTRERIDGAFRDIEVASRNTVGRVSKASSLLRVLMFLWMVVIIIKSFLYVLSRVIFDKATEIHVDLLEQESDPAEGSVRHVQEVSIAGAYPYTMFYKADYQPLGPAPRFDIPQWRASILSRLRFGAWNMSRVDMPTEDARGLTFNAIEAEHLVDWTMKDGEEVVFSYRNFVAMNSNVELRTVISLRVATLLMGRIVFHTARCKGGDGRLILRTRGKPATADQVRQSIPASRLIAWNRYARFSVDSHLTRKDIFLNGFNLRREGVDDDTNPQGILVVEADARSGGVMVGTLRFAKHFLLPV